MTSIKGKETPDLVIGGNFTEAPYSMFSARSEAESRGYKLITGKSGRRWLYNDEIVDAGDAIYVEGGPNSRGFGGSTLAFPLLAGGTLSLKGPWHSNSNALFADTGVDLRNRRLVWGCIGRRREYHNDQSATCDLLWFDREPIEGPLDRVEQLAARMSDERGEALYYFWMTRGCSTSGSVNYHRFKVAP